METPSETGEAWADLPSLDQRHPVEIGSVGASVGRCRPDLLEAELFEPAVHPGPALGATGKLDEIVHIFIVHPADDLLHQLSTDTLLAVPTIHDKVFDGHLGLAARDSDDDRCRGDQLLAIFTLLIHHEICVVVSDNEK